MKRVVVLGTTGSGKSTVATELAQRLGLPHVQLDAIAHGPNWTPVEPDVFRAKVAELARAERWLFDGNYIARIADAVWPLADTIVWLDLPLRIVLPRIVRRSIKRISTREELWNGNRERWSALIGRDSLLAWAVSSHRRHSVDLPPLLAGLARTGTTVVRLRSQREISTWLSCVTAP